MCELGTIIAAGTTIASTFVKTKAATEAYDTQKYDAVIQQSYLYQKQATEEKYRTDLMEYQNTTYKQDIEYGGKLLDYQKTEFARQQGTINRARDGYEKNYFAKVGALLQRQVEETMATAFGDQDAAEEGAAARAKAQVGADVRGVSGNSVDAVRNDISRKEGDTRSTNALNGEATQRQLMLQAMGLHAEEVQSLYGLQQSTFNALTNIQAPSPVAPVTPAGTVTTPSATAKNLNVASALLDGVSGLAKNIKFSDFSSLKL